MQQFRKGDYVIMARWAYPGDDVYNYLEDCEYKTSDEKCIVLHGTVEEEWPITFERLMSTYTYENGDDICNNDLGSVFEQCWGDDPRWIEIRPIQSFDAPTVFAEPTDLDEIIEVETSWGDVLTTNLPGIPHGNGDWIVYENAGGYPDENNRRVVNGAVFETTYEEA